jgi:RNA polymerase sigma-70 factor (ECF subfamily)
MAAASSTTSLSLLQGMRQRDPIKWKRFATIYTPLVYSWCRRSAVPEQEAGDVAQEVFRAVAAGIDSFRRDQPGDSFRGWMWGICYFKIKDYFRQRMQHPAAIGGSEVLDRLNNLPVDMPQVVDERNEREDAQLIYYRALELIQEEFEARTWQAFWRVVVDEQSAAEVGRDLGMSPGAVYNANYKVLRRLRQEFDGLM